MGGRSKGDIVMAVSKAICDTLIVSCLCGRNPRRPHVWESNYKGNFCQKCGKKYKAETPRLQGVLVAYEGIDTECYDNFLTFKELKKLLKEA